MILRLLHCVNLAADGLCALCGGDLEGDELVGPTAFAALDSLRAIKSSTRLGHLHTIIRRELANAKDAAHANPKRWSAAVEMWARLAELFEVSP